MECGFPGGEFDYIYVPAPKGLGSTILGGLETGSASRVTPREGRNPTSGGPFSYVRSLVVSTIGLPIHAYSIFNSYRDPTPSVVET